MIASFATVIQYITLPLERVVNYSGALLSNRLLDNTVPASIPNFEKSSNKWTLLVSSFKYKKNKFNFLFCKFDLI